MNMQQRYQWLFGNSIIKSETYEQRTDAVLKEVDAEINPCLKSNNLARLANDLNIKSMSCSRLRGLLPFLYNYRQETSQRASFLQREAKLLQQECTIYVENLRITEQREHQSKMKAIEEQARVEIEKERELTDRQRLQLKKQLTQNKNKKIR